MGTPSTHTQLLPAEITKAASKQTYFTIRLLVDRKRVDDAFRAYGYFRWLDDILDASTGTLETKKGIVQRQRNLLEDSYRGEQPEELCPEEAMLVDLIQNDTGRHPGLRSYLNQMMAVMEFDVERRRSVITQAELDWYTNTLAVAVTDALFYFIGHDDPPPAHPARYHAVTAAHIIHMLRDTYEDMAAGYYNVSFEYLQQHGIHCIDRESPVPGDWVCHRVTLARQYFTSGRAYIGQVKNFRCRLAGFAYAARFEWVLRAIEREHFCLREDYSQRKRLPAFIRMTWSTLISMLVSLVKPITLDLFAEQTFRIQES